jgi:hypothetical protein
MHAKRASWLKSSIFHQPEAAICPNKIKSEYANSIPHLFYSYRANNNITNPPQPWTAVYCDKDVHFSIHVARARTMILLFWFQRHEFVIHFELKSAVITLSLGLRGVIIHETAIFATGAINFRSPQLFLAGMIAKLSLSFVSLNTRGLNKVDFFSFGHKFRKPRWVALLFSLVSVHENEPHSLHANRLTLCQIFYLARFW